MKRKLARSRAAPRWRKPGTPAKTAFTLIELLAVIAIIAILAALLLPALARTKAAGISAACKSNLHQIGIGLSLYTSQQEHYPPLWQPEALGVESQFHYWDYTLLPFEGRNLNLFLCPAKKPSSVWTNLNFPNPTYGYNAGGTAKEEPLGLSDFSRNSASFVGLSEARVQLPSEMIAIGDYMEIRSPQFGNGQDGDIAGALDEQDDYVADRHSGGANVVFCDTHVEFAKQTNWMKAVASVRERWNNDHQPHPETWH